MGLAKFARRELLPGLMLLAGCASQGPLRPPSLHLPTQVRGLSAERVGDAVDLHWTNPVRTSDGILLDGKHGPAPLVIEICRAEVPAACVAAARVPATTGEQARYHDTLPARLAAGPARLLTYQVRAVNAAGKGLQPATVHTAAGSAPHPVTGLSAEPVSRGAALHWRPDADGALDRLVLQVERGAPAPDGAVQAATVKRDILAVEPNGFDPGGAVDTGRRRGIPQCYTVQRTRTVHLPGGEDLKMSSSPSTVAVRADALPAPLPPPDGLEAVVSTLDSPEVALVWEPVDGAAGYRIFRAVGAGAAVPLPDSPVQAFTYSDRAVTQGERVRYSLATVDADGQTGPRSREVEVVIPAR